MRAAAGFPSAGAHEPRQPIGQEAPNGAQRPPVDPVLSHLLLAARSDAVRENFLAETSVEELTDEHELTLLVGFATPHYCRTAHPPAVARRRERSAGRAPTAGTVSCSGCRRPWARSSFRPSPQRAHLHQSPAGQDADLGRGFLRYEKRGNETRMPCPSRAGR